MNTQTSCQAWTILERMFASRTRARAIQTRVQLAIAKKKGTSAAEYFRQMKALADTLAAISQPLSEDDIIAYILVGLSPDYDSLVTTLTVRSDNLTLDEVYAHLLAYEHCNDLHEFEYGIGASANFSRRGGGHSSGGGQGSHGSGNPSGGYSSGGGGRGKCRNRGRGRNGGSGGGRGNGGGTSSNNSGDDSRPICQICGKVGHATLRYRRRFDHAFTGDVLSSLSWRTGMYYCLLACSLCVCGGCRGGAL
nr:uncharacterized protein LOC127348014 [Lolium perenne]